jgi:hypothetical protein
MTTIIFLVFYTYLLRKTTFVYVSLNNVLALWRWSNKQTFNDALPCKEKGILSVVSAVQENKHI